MVINLYENALFVTILYLDKIFATITCKLAIYYCTISGQL